MIIFKRERLGGIRKFTILGFEFSYISKKDKHLIGPRLLDDSKIKPCNFKWGVSYSVFDGEELLEASILSIRNQADYVNVVYQTTSWHGLPCKPSLLKTLEDIKAKGLIDELIFFEPNLELNPHRNEITKRNIGLKAAKKAGCDYFMTMDTDEFYFEHEVIKAKEYIVKKGITHSFCAQITYGYEPTSRQITSNKKCYVEFFSKLKSSSKCYAKNRRIPCLVDATRCLSHFFGAKYWVLNIVFMNHMSYVRKDLKAKYMNTSGNGKLVECGDSKFKVLNKDEFIEVPNYFNIHVDIDQRN